MEGWGDGERRKTQSRTPTGGLTSLHHSVWEFRNDWDTKFDLPRLPNTLSLILNTTSKQHRVSQPRWIMSTVLSGNEGDQWVNNLFPVNNCPVSTNTQTHTHDNLVLVQPSATWANCYEARMCVTGCNWQCGWILELVRARAFAAVGGASIKTWTPSTQVSILYLCSTWDDSGPMCVSVCPQVCECIFRCHQCSQTIKENPV